MKKIIGTAAALVFLSGVACAAKSTYVVNNGRFNYVKIKEVKASRAQELNITHPATIDEAGLRAALASINLARSYVIKKEVDTQRVFDDAMIDYIAPAMVRAFSQAGPNEIIVFSYLSKNPIFILRNDRLNICDAWISNDELHIRFQKLYAKMTGDTDKRGSHSKLISNARGLRVRLELGPGQKLGVDDPEEIVLGLNVNYVKVPEKEAPVTEGVTMTGERVPIEGATGAAQPAAVEKSSKAQPKKGSKASGVKGAEAASPAAAPAPARSAKDRLEELGQLRKSGLIDKADYEAKKKEILDEL
ncbi:MAG TPA: SHOCT domain-containing protein [bacterium]|nr:SHOCT domain-containing protein [bacterium]